MQKYDRLKQLLRDTLSILTPRLTYILPGILPGAAAPDSRWGHTAWQTISPWRSRSFQFV